MATTTIGVDVGGHRIRAARFDEQNEIQASEKTDTYPGGGSLAKALETHSQQELQRIVLDRLIEAIRKVLPDNRDEVSGIGLALPGPVNDETGILIAPPALPFRNLNIRDEVRNAVGVPVFIGNDADVAGLAEFHHPRGARRTRLDALKLQDQDVRYLIYITVSTGVGGGLILNGRPFGGRGQGAEVGHMVVDPNGPMCGCGHPGHLEAISSGTGIARQARYRVEAGESTMLREMVQGDIDRINAKLVGEAAEKGDALALDVITKAGRALGVAVASLMVLFNPDMFVFGGSVTQVGKLLFDPMSEAVRRYVMHPLYWERTPLCMSELGDDVGLYGAAALVALHQG
jgi:glucokinase